MEKHTTIKVDHATRDKLQRGAQIKRWSLAELLRVFADLFSCGLGLLNGCSIPIRSILQPSAVLVLILYVHEFSLLFRPAFAPEHKPSD